VIDCSTLETLVIEVVQRAATVVESFSPTLFAGNKLTVPRIPDLSWLPKNSHAKTVEVKARIQRRRGIGELVEHLLHSGSVSSRVIRHIAKTIGNTVEITASNHFLFLFSCFKKPTPATLPPKQDGRGKSFVTVDALGIFQPNASWRAKREQHLAPEW